MEQPKTPKAATRTFLNDARSSIEPQIEIDFETSKSEMYALTAYFIELAMADLEAWQAANPGMVQYREVTQYDSETDEINTSLRVTNAAEYLNETDTEILLKKISNVIWGSVADSVRKVMESAANETSNDNPVFKYKAYRRLARLLVSRDGGRTEYVTDFIADAAAAPAMSIPAVYYAGLQKFKQAYGHYPTSDSELEQLSRALEPVLLQIAQFNRKEVELLADPIRPDEPTDPLRVDGLVELIEMHQTDTGFRFTAERTKDLIKNAEPKLVDATVGCPSLYAMRDGKNVARFLFEYATSLLKQSPLFKNGQ